MEARPSILAHNYERKVFNLIDHRVTIQEAHSAMESQDRKKIKNEDLDLDEIPIFKSDSTYLDKGIKEEIVPQSISEFQYEDEIKREETTLNDMPNFEMDSSYLDKTIKKEIKLEPLI